MAVTGHSGGGRGESAPDTLGDLLYSDPSKTPVPEAEWVELVRSIAAGDQYALRSLYDRAHRMVFTLAVRITNHPQAAEEVTVDVFHDLWRRAPAYDPADGSVLGWIMNQARSRAIDRVRFDHRKKRSGDTSELPLPAAVGPAPHEVFDVNEQARAFQDALAALTADERQAIEVAYFADLTHSQVAARLDQPLGTIKTRIRSGLSKLRQALTATGPEP